MYVSFNVSEYISDILIKNENMSSGKCLTLVKATLLTGQGDGGASLPTYPSRDIMANIPIEGMSNLCSILVDYSWLCSNLYHKGKQWFCFELCCAESTVFMPPALKVRGGGGGI